MQYKSIDIILTKQNLNHKKWLLYAIAAVMLAVNLLLTVSVIAGGIGGQWVCLLLMTLLDAILMPVIANSNFRFKYSCIIPILYVLLSTVLVIVATAVGVGLFTTGAAFFFVVVHLLTLVAFLLAVFAGSGYGTVMRVVTLAVAALAALLSLIYFCVFCAIGYHGQSTGGSRLLHYSYDWELKGYVVTGALGRSDTVIVPDSFDGRPVKGVDCAIFADDGIDAVYMQCGEDVTFFAHDALLETDASIYFPKQQMDVMKEKQLQSYVWEQDVRYLNVCNMIQPSNVSRDEVYISFNYTAETLSYMKKQMIPTWFGTKGETFSLAAYAAELAAKGIELPFAEDYDINSEAFLYENYLRNQKVLCPLADGERVVDQTAIQESIAHLMISFEPVYRVKISADNDSRYEISTGFDGSGYRYTLGNDHLDLLGSFDARPGFDLTWQYTSGNFAGVGTVESLSALLPQHRNLVLHPVWVLHTPEIVSEQTGTDLDNNETIYGETVTFNAEAKAPAEGIALQYRWSYGGEVKNATGTTGFTMINAKPGQSGIYELVVTAGNDASTSLTSTTTYRILVTINRRPLKAIWTLPSGSDLVYTAQNKSFSCACYAAGLINGDAILSDDISYQILRNGARVDNIYHAGTYQLTAEINGEMGELYYIPITNESNDHSDAVEQIVIQRRVVTASWSTNTFSFTYNGNTQGPRITALDGVIGADSASDVLDSVRYENGYQRNAGTYQMIVSLPENGDYQLAQGTCSYTIAPAKIPLSAISWETQTSFVYNGKLQSPTVTAISTEYVKGSDRVADILAAIVYSERQKNVGSGYVITASLPQNYNYAFAATASAEFSITAKRLDFTWSNTDLTYNGTIQAPVAMAQGLVSGDRVTLQYSSGARDAGNYTVSVISIGNANYYLGSDSSFSYEIKPRKVELVWGSASFVYNGNAQAPKVTDLKNALEADKAALIAGITVNGKQTNAGNYTASAVLGNSNYAVEGSTVCSYAITKRGVTLVWDVKSVYTYSGSAQAPTVSGAEGLATGDSVSTIIAAITYSNKGTNAGNHTVSASLNHKNYTVSQNATCSYKIQPKTLTATWESKSFTYNGSAQYPKITALSGIVGSDSFASLSTGIYYENYGVDAGNYTVKAHLNNGNYQLSVTEKSYTINKKSISIIWNSDTSLTYDGTAKYYSGTTNGYDQFVRFSYWQNGVEVKAPVNVGTYKAQAEVTNKNYTLTGTTSKTFTITQ